MTQLPGQSYAGWRCDECGTISAGSWADDGDEYAREALAEGQPVDGVIGCPCCPYQTSTRPVTVTVEPREIR